MFIRNRFSPLQLTADNLALLYRQAAEAYGDDPALARRLGSGNHEFISYRQLYRFGCEFATALIDLGLRPREHVAIFSDNRPEWMICDYGVLIAGCADVPRGSDLTPEEIVYIATHADIQLMLVENLPLLHKVLSVQDRLPHMLRLVLMDPAAEPPPGILHLPALLRRGADLLAAGDRRAEERLAAIRPDDFFTIIYTSGTTGTPKGVVLTHANMISQVRNVPWAVYRGDRMLSILPIWHSYERVVEMIGLSRGACTYYTSLRHIGDDLKTVKPTVMASAPRLWESLHDRIQKNIHGLSPFRRQLFRLAYFLSRMVQGSWWFVTGRKIDLRGRTLLENLALGAFHWVRGLVFFLPYLLLDRIILKKLREVVGGAFRGTVSGGGALPPYVDEFFNYIGIPVLEGYGMTETSPVTAVRTDSTLIIGTVGLAIPETEFRIVDLETGRILYPDPHHKGGGRGLRGELHVRGPQVMPGYYKMPAETARVLHDGWMKTGDIALITFNNCLKLVGRCKETIVLLSGENVEPLPIESHLSECPAILQAMVVGQDQKHLSVLIVPSLEYFQKNGHPHVQSLAELVTLPEVHQHIQAAIKRQVSASAGFKPFEQIVGFRLLSKPFETGDELTHTFKLKRHVITKKYEPEIAALYPSR